MDDTRIIDLFFNRSENAISELYGKYGTLCMSVAMRVLDSKEDAEECVNSALLGVWNSIPPERPSSLLAFVCRISRNIAISRYREINAEKRSGYTLCLDELEDKIPSPHTVEEEINVSSLANYINEFLATLSKTNRLIFVRRYWYMDDYADIAELMGMREGAVRTRLFRTRDELKRYLAKKGVNV